MQSTTSSLLDGLTDSKSQAWNEVDRRFRPALVGFAQRLGLPHQDAADIAQETLIDFYRQYGTRYRRERGRLRTWMFTVARRNVIDCLRARARSREQSSMDLDHPDPSEDRIVATWLAECQRTLLWMAIQELSRCSRLKPQTIKAFRFFGIEGRPAAVVAQELGMSLDAVYMAKHHCLHVLRQHMAEIAEDYGVNISFE